MSDGDGDGDGSLLLGRTYVHARRHTTDIRMCVFGDTMDAYVG